MTPHWCRAAVVVSPPGLTGRFSTKEVIREDTETTHQLETSAPTHRAADPVPDHEGATMKTIAARFDDDLFELLALVAHLEETSIVEQIRDAVDAHVKAKIANGDLEARAASIVAEIDEEAKARKATINSLLGQAKGPAKRGRRPKAEPKDESPDGE